MIAWQRQAKDIPALGFSREELGFSLTLSRSGKLVGNPVTYVINLPLININIGFQKCRIPTGLMFAQEKVLKKRQTLWWIRLIISLGCPGESTRRTIGKILKNWWKRLPENPMIPVCSQLKPFLRIGIRQIRRSCLYGKKFAEPMGNGLPLNWKEKRALFMNDLGYGVMAAVS